MADVQRLQFEIIMDETGAVVGAKKIKKSTDEIEKNAKKSSKKMSSFTQTIKDNWLKIAAVITGAVLLIKKAFDFSKEFLEYRQGMDALARNTGENADKMVAKLREVTQGTVANKDIMLAANRLVALNVTRDTDKMAQLFEIARLKGKAMGITTSQAISDISTGIGRASPLILDNLGIITKGWGEEAEAAGKAMDAQFILNKILKQGAEELSRTGAKVTTGAERMQMMSASASNLKIALGKFVSDGLGPVVTWITKVTTELGDMLTAFAAAQKETGQSRDALKEFGIETKKEIAAVEQLANEYLKWNDASKTIQAGLKTQQILQERGETLSQRSLNTLRAATLQRIIARDEMVKYKKVLEDTEIKTGLKAAEVWEKRNQLVEEANEIPPPPPPIPGADEMEEGEATISDFYEFMNMMRELNTVKENETYQRLLDANILDKEQRLALAAEHQLNLSEIETDAIEERQELNEAAFGILGKNYDDLTDKQKDSVDEMKSNWKDLMLTMENLSDTFVDSFLAGIDDWSSSSEDVIVSILKGFINMIAGTLQAYASFYFVTGNFVGAIAALAAAATVKALGGTIANLITGAAEGGLVPEMAEQGGKIHGSSHAGGGVNINAEGGEYIIKKSNVTPVTIPILDAINRGMGNIAALTVPSSARSFQVGGPVSRDERRMVSIDKVELAAESPRELFEQFLEMGEDMGIDMTRRG